MNRTQRHNLRSRVEAPIIQYEYAVRLIRGSKWHADENALGARIYPDPNRMTGGPVGLIPQRLNFLGDLDGLAAIRKVKPGAVSDSGPVFAHIHPVYGGRAHRAGNFA